MLNALKMNKGWVSLVMQHRRYSSFIYFIEFKNIINNFKKVLLIGSLSK